ncbi:FadR family transcriptional regulator [bacterium]|nr:MAG: FadR family transcriptional regulator [bacterium]
MTSAAPIKRQPLSRQVLRTLRDYIEEHNLGPGDRLPTERELSEDLGVSRNTIRESLGVLEAIGIIKRGPKTGAILQEADLESLGEVTQFLLRSRGDLEDLFEARRTLEISLMPLIVAHADEEDFAKLEKAVEDMKRDIERGGLGTDGDIAFHHALLHAAGNSLLMQFGALIQEFLRAPRTRMLLDPDKAQSSITDHLAIIDALRAHDVARAQSEMERHLSTYTERVFNKPRKPTKAKRAVASN